MADIELVIKLNEDTYNTFKNLNQIIGVLSFEKDTLALIKAVKNGIPLPKGHGRLIDADKIVYETECEYTSDGSCTIIRITTPTIIKSDSEENI